MTSDVLRRCIAIGNFDGVHLGHQLVLDHVLAASDRLRARSAVLSFEPHPREFFAKRANRRELIPTKVYSLRQKLEALKAYGIEDVFIQRFDSRLSALPPEAFVLEYLVGRLNAQSVCVGEDFRFGQDRGGDVQLLRSMGRRLGFDVTCLDAFRTMQGVRVSSSSLRLLLAAGEFDEVNKLIGRPYQLEGRVTDLDAERTQRQPATLTVRLDNRRPAIEGVISTTIRIASESGTYRGTALATADGSRYVKVRAHSSDGLLAGNVIGASVRLAFGNRGAEPLE